MKKEIIACLAILLLQTNPILISKKINNETKQLTFKEAFKNQLELLIKEENESWYLRDRKLDKYFGEKERQRVREISKKLGIEPQWLYEVIWYESRGNPQAVNYQKGDNLNPEIRCKKRATGLIQFLPKTSKRLGTSNIKIYNMTVLEQLDYVEKYLKKCDDKYNLESYIDTYLAVFHPIALGNKHIVVSGKGAEQNPNVDINKDGIITIKEFTEYANKS
jgi:hypothetical protein